jgi:hypothetical protein
MASDRSTLIDSYERGADQTADAIHGLARDVLLRKPPAGAGPELGKWSIQEVVIHLADAEAALADRIKRIVAEDDAVLQAWDETRFAERLAYQEQSAPDAAVLIALTRRQVARILRAIPDAAFDRTGRHTERGPQTATQVIGMAVDHLENHLKFIRAKRALFGK